MTVSVPLVVIFAVVALACYRWMGLKLWHLIVCLILGFLLAFPAPLPVVQHVINELFHGSGK